MALTPQFGSIVPSQGQQLLNSNYLQFNGAGAGANNFAQQYLPEIYEQEVERYGNRTLSGFLRMVGAEMPMTSDQVIWSEQNRLHISYNNVLTGAAGGTANNLTIPVAAGIVNVISLNDTIVILDPVTGNEAKALVTASNTATGVLVVQPYSAATIVATFGAANAGLKIFVYGSDYGKGSQIATGTGVAGAQAANTRVSVNPSFTQFSNSPIILRSQYTISGSDMSQIGWVEVATEDGTSGYLWYLKAESETRLRFEDYLEMSMVEGEFNQNAATLATNPGTQGLFAAIQTRGNVEVGFTAAAGLDEFDAILKNLDTQGAIEENMLFLQRQTSLDFDDMLASISGGFAGGTAFGLFENSEEMALNLGFSGFRRGSYDFYKTDWKYLNDASTRGASTGISSVEGVLVPAGTSTVYDQILGTNIRRPFLHVRYRASASDDRRMKSWLTGSAGGATTSTLDAMEVNFLSERCLVTQAANNFVLFKGI
jgi:arginine repressor